MFGSSRYVPEVAKRWADKGHEVHIFASRWDRMSHPNVSFHRVPSIFSSRLLPREAWMTLAHTVAQKFRKFDVTLAQPTRYFTPDVGEMQFVYKSWVDWKRKNGTKDSLKIRLSDAWLQWMERRNVKKASHLIALAECVKRDITSGYGIEPGKVTVAYSGTNLDEFRPENRGAFRREIRERHGIGDDELLLLFVGNPFSRKGLDRVIEALPLLEGRKYRLLVCGKDDPSPFIEAAKRLGVDKKIVWNIGLTTEINKYFAASDAFVFPTRYEPFGLVITEAMASGLPVITSAVSGAAELIADGKEGMLLKDPEDSGRIAAFMKALADSPTLRKAMGEAARKKAEEYTWDGTAATMLDVLQKAAEQKRTGRSN